MQRYCDYSGFLSPSVQVEGEALGHGELCQLSNMGHDSDEDGR